MANLDDIVESRTDLDADDVDWLHRLTADWQIIADLAFADLVLWLPDRDRSGFWAAGQMRPTTGPTALHDDVVGTFVAWNEDHMLRRAYEHGRSVREGDPEWRSDIPVRVETIPVRRGERVIAVVARNTNLLGVRTPSQLELAYLEAASELNRMIERGGFPSTAARSAHADTPRVGDGFVRIDAAGQVSYASPNAQSVYRKLGHTGDLSGHVLADLTRQLVPPKLRPDEETLSAVLGDVRTSTPRSTPTGSASSPARFRCGRPATTPAPSCCCATSPISVVAIVSWSPRTPPSARSTTG